MDPDQTVPLGAVWLGLIVFALMIQSCLKFIWIYMQQMQKAETIFKTKNYWQDNGETQIWWQKYDITTCFMKKMAFIVDLLLTDSLCLWLLWNNSFYCQYINM